MKHLILTTALCLSLTACETVSDMSWPSLNPFGGDEVVEETVAPTATINQSAVQTELDEMEKLTGTRVKVQDFVAPEETIIEIVESPSIEDVNANVIEAETKMTEMVEAEKIEVVEEIIEVTEPTEIVKEDIPVVEIPTTAHGCPKIEIIPAAKSITNFESNMSGQMTSRASITDVKGGCEIVNGGMEIDLDILMRGTITNKGRFEGKVNEEAFVTFPYFVSVIKPDGMPIDKKIMATAMRFRPSVDFVDHAEKITQFVPMDDVNNSGNYTITVGYQLTRKQLEYNQIETNARPSDKRASPDTSKAKRRSYNPLAGE